MTDSKLIPDGDDVLRVAMAGAALYTTVGPCPERPGPASR